MIAYIFLLIGAAAAIAVTSVQVVLTVLFRRSKRSPGGTPGDGGRGHPRAYVPFLSILKPMCRLDDELEQNLASFATLRGVDYEVICSVADPNDPALEVLERVRRAHPAAPFRLAIGGDPRLELRNRKVARLIAAVPLARGEIVMISDSNVRVDPDDVARTLEAFRDPRVGCVSNLFVGEGAQDLGARLESLHLLGFVVPGNVIAAFAGVTCVVGKSMALRRKTLRAIGGFEAFSNVLAEDQAIGLAVREAGWDVALSPTVVRNVVVRRSVRRALDRQIRWNKIRYAMSKAAYAAELLVFPLPLAVLAALAGVLAGAAGACLLPVVAMMVRIAQMAVLARATGARLGITALACVPLLDVLQFGAQFVPYFDDTVTWRGYTLRIGPNTVMQEAA